jgi:uncharacterized membrane protein (DUF106 family)
VKGLLRRIEAHNKKVQKAQSRGDTKGIVKLQEEKLRLQAEMIALERPEDARLA